MIWSTLMTAKMIRFDPDSGRPKRSSARRGRGRGARSGPAVASCEVPRARRERSRGRLEQREAALDAPKA